MFNQVPEVRDGFPEKENYHKRDVSASAPGIFVQVYLDESGDTGWNFAFPFRNGGSSRFLCLAFLFLPNDHRKITEQIVIDLYKKYRWLKERKASKTSQKQKLEFANSLNALLQNVNEIKIDCIVVKKENVQPHIRADPNKLYNYMCKLVVIDYVKKVAEVEFIPDNRTIKVASGNSLSDYLQTTLWFECGVATTLRNNPQQSDRNYNLQFVDWIAHCVWAHFEDGETRVFSEVSRHIKIRQLFF